ncbi:MAG: M28 family peptidase [Bacteroidetes bacterium]|nr:M28 family peptidase [Bacteroidota bacterium]
MKIKEMLTIFTNYMNICHNKIKTMTILTFLLTNLTFSQTIDKTKISTSNLESHLRFLADDLLEGREAGLRGEKLAAKYISSHFEQNNLKPLQQSNSYFQSFPLIKISVDNSSNFILSDSAKDIFRYNNFGKDFFFSSNSYDTTITEGVIFAGYGLSIPELWNDIDTTFSYKNKILVFLTGLPKSFDSLQNKKYGFQSSANYKRGVARRLNASGVILISENGKELKEAFADQYASMLKGIIRSPELPMPKDIPLVFVTNEVGQNILGGNRIYNEIITSLNSKKGITKSIYSKLTLNIKTNTTILTGENVIGFIEGSDKELKNEYIIITSHYDHVGVNLLNGNVYNGADDDGSGTVTLLELARIISNSETKPKRSLIFMTVSGEEKGLLGSRYFVNNPLVPINSIKANINIDMIGRTDAKHDSLKQENYIYVIGSDKISKDVDSLLIFSNKKYKLNLDYTFNREEDPNRFYYRSDHYNFALKNIPVIFFFSGVHVDYHQPSDDVDKIRFDLMTERAKLIYSTLINIANYPKEFKKIDLNK